MCGAAARVHHEYVRPSLFDFVVVVAVVALGAVAVVTYFGHNLRALFAASSHCGLYQPRIKVDVDVGGELDEETFPASGYLASTPARGQRFGKVRCGQTLIAPRVAVTAAHCVESELTAGFGRAPSPGDKYDPDSRDFYAVTQTRVHPGYHEPDRNDDIALVFLDREVKGVRPAELDGLRPSLHARIASFGYAKRPGHNERRRSILELREIFPFRGLPSSLVADPVDGGACYGDSGSGATTPGSDVLVALHVAGPAEYVDAPCPYSNDRTCPGYRCKVGGPETLVAIAGHREWIQKEISRSAEAKSGVRSSRSVVR
jgi:hypothetical protein